MAYLEQEGKAVYGEVDIRWPDVNRGRKTSIFVPLAGGLLDRRGSQLITTITPFCAAWTAGKTTKVFPALEWLANLCSHIPNRCGQMARCYGFRNTVRHYSSIGNPHVNSNSKTLDLVGEDSDSGGWRS